MLLGPGGEVIMPDRDCELVEEPKESGVESLSCEGALALQVEHRSGVKGLLYAVLEESIRCFLGADARLRFEAEQWIESGDRRWAFSFVTVCEALGLEPSAVRVALRRMQERNTSPKTISRQKMRG
jgi:hypothetical protein